MDIQVINGDIPALTYRSNSSDTMFVERVLLWKYKFGIGSIINCETTRTIGDVNFIAVELSSGAKFEAKISNNDLILLITKIKSGKVRDDGGFEKSISVQRVVFALLCAFFVLGFFIKDKPKEKGIITSSSYDEVCKYAVSLIFQRDPTTISIDKKYNDSSPTTQVSYIRENDKSFWNMECMYKGNEIYWRLLPESNFGEVGRWRDVKGSDENISFSTSNDKITVYLSEADGSGKRDTTFHMVY